ncbi:MAG: DegT/DnrJ/EryC1/StrS family aminotransferase [Blastomonas sp.]|jgi:UDP-2-acetamido-2-deoxy-ribo-hexuluronate aminotransferase
MTLPFIDLKAQYRALQPRIRERMDAVLEHGQYIMGPEVAELERALEAFTGAAHCVTVASGTEALLIALMALDIGPGSEVITSPFTFIATVETIVLAGATPVFVDIDPGTCNLDPARIEAAITPRTRAIIPVSLYGQPADMDAINAVAQRHGNIVVMEDAAQSFGSTLHGRQSCNLSDIGCTSFFPSKPLGCYGDGGAMFTSDDTLAQAFREIRVHGQSQRYVHTRVGVGGRMDTLQCAVVLAKLERFEEEVALRGSIGARYRSLLEPLAGRIDEGAPLELLRLQDGATHVHAQFTVAVADRARVQKALTEDQIPTAVHYPVPLNQQPAYRHLGDPDATPLSAMMAGRVISLPMGPDLSAADQDRVVEAVARAIRD